MLRSSARRFGIVEGFYGAFYTFPERDDLIAFCASHGLNTYVYGPKNDRQHRARWWEPYPPEVMAQFAQTVALAKTLGVTFVYTLSPMGVQSGDIGMVMGKLAAFLAIGVRDFGILFDDMANPEQAGSQAEREEAQATHHAVLTNGVLAALRVHDQSCTLLVCPAEYHGLQFTRYLHTLGQNLDPAIDLCYTGSAICPATISAADAAAFADAACRPPLIWDNYPANDLDMRGELHLGPLLGREPDLPAATRGILFNPMNQAEASKIALATCAAYLRDSVEYQPWVAWDTALLASGGGRYAAALRGVAAQTLASCLAPVAAPELAALAEAALAELHDGQGATASPALQLLEANIDMLDEHCYTIKNRLTNLRLRDNIITWVEALEDWVWLGRRAIHGLRNAENGNPSAMHLDALRESLGLVERHHRRMCGDALVPLAAYALAVLEAAEKQSKTSLGGQRPPNP